MDSSNPTPPPERPKPQAPAADRPHASSVKRLLVIGLDGATFDVLNPLMEAGRMPVLKELIKTGSAGVLNSTKPPITPAAWTTFMTGQGPGQHGIIDFERYEPESAKLAFNSTLEIRQPTIWQILSRKGLRVGSIQVPMTYPPREVNGFMISGFETPSTDVDFTYPKQLKQEILKRWPDYSYKAEWKRKRINRKQAFRENLEYIKKSFQQGYELTRFCGDHYGWDVMMVLYKLVDNLQHKTWKYLDPKYKDRYPKQAEQTADCFVALDEVLGKLTEYARSNDASILIMSDHGHGSLDGKAQPNLLLKQWGFLDITSQRAQAKQRASTIINRMLGKTQDRFEANKGIEHELVVDWSRTKACVMHAGIYGFLYINLKGRQPDGIVPQKEYESLRNELRRRFRSVAAKHPSQQAIHVFPEVHKPEELYGCSREDQPWLPDLLLVPEPGLAVVRKIRGSQAVRWSSERRLEGTHRIEGILIANGAGFRKGNKVEANMADVAPTILAGLGLNVPEDMEGQVIEDLFDKTPTIEFESADAQQAEQSRDVYTEEEKEALMRRLTDLGYLE